MGKLIFGMHVSIDGYVADVDGTLNMPPPDATLFRYWIDHTRDLGGSLYGRRLYEVMRYWDDDRAEWDAAEHDFAAAWRAQQKWVISASLESVGPNTTLIRSDFANAIRRLKADVDGTIAVGGPELAASLTELGLIDEYHLYVRPFVLGGGKPYFAGARTPLSLVDTQRIGDDTLRLTFVPAP